MAHSTGLSFAASTLVETPKGQQAIASLKVGDQVMAYDPKTGKATTQTVQQVFLNHDTDLLNVTLRTTAKPTQRTTSPAMDPAYKQRMVAVASHGSHAPPSSTATASSTAATKAEAAYNTAAAQPGDKTFTAPPIIPGSRQLAVESRMDRGQTIACRFALLPCR